MSDHGLREPSTLPFERSSTRIWVLSSYLVLVALALPVWWSTTSIQRLSLPTSNVESLGSRELHLPISVVVNAASPDARKLRTILESRKDKMSALYRRLEFFMSPSRNVCQLTRHSGQSALPDAYSISLTEDTQFPTIQKRHLSVPMHQANQAPDLLLNLLTPYGTPSPPGTFQHLVAKYSPRYRLAFTLLNEDAAAGRAVVGWDVAEMISRWIAPVLKQMSELHNFTIESQIRFYAPLAFEPLVLSNGQDVLHGLTQENLKVFVNSAEWTLASGVSNDPVLHFVVFVPSISRTPLRILDDSSQPISSNSFVLPQWGGIVLLNLPADSPQKHRLTEAELDHVFVGFRAQLLRLLGVSELPPEVQSSEPSQPLTDFQLETLYRQRTFENAGITRETLQSIVKLVDQISNMPVGQDVRNDLLGALSALEMLYARAWSVPALGLQHSTRALTLASRAFFNPGMLALLYFPAEHKYAVYTPLFAPVAIPLLVTLLREISAWRKARKRGNAS
ncbi:phosphatidylinositol-glycan biosynthesis class S protein-domain-containing protein [Russula dissimulans]|nr:phosphatidylinositol-glycan biosynthesis class S protein-domain-containing protein [Russula dissimulans]